MRFNVPVNFSQLRIGRVKNGTRETDTRDSEKQKEEIREKESEREQEREREEQKDRKPEEKRGTIL